MLCTRYHFVKKKEQHISVNYLYYLSYYSDVYVD